MHGNDWMDRIEAGEVPHAILFAGPKESDRLALARRAAARYLLHTDRTDALLLLTGTESGFRPTILSRCMVLRAETEPWETIADRLVKNGADRKKAVLAAKLSDGVYGRAEAFLSEESLAFRREALACIRRFAAKSRPYAALAELCTDTVTEENEDGTVKKTKKVSPTSSESATN